MDKAEEIFAEGIEDRNVKTIRQARVLFVICLMAGMFIIFESDDIFKWVAVLAVYFFTDSFYKKTVKSTILRLPTSAYMMRAIALYVIILYTMTVHRCMSRGSRKSTRHRMTV